MLAIATLARLTGMLAPSRRDVPRSPTHPKTSADMDEFVTIATYDNSTDAHIALGRLSAEGIEAVLFDDHMVQMDWLYSIALGGVKLRVTRSDEVAARKVLATDYSAVLNDSDEGDSGDSAH